MALEFDSDFAGYFDADFGHGIQATYTPSGGSASTIKVILEKDYFSVPGLSVDVEGSQPIAYCRTTDVASERKEHSAFAARITKSGNKSEVQQHQSSQRTT
ncbi:MAG: hypothetical protein CM15mV144_370 [Caudoviricetes sp.]|nr:MAG: hypothetical protein CM15mV144_370 [Caudoviricetes sp.]